MRIPFSAPFPVPTMIEVGVANPRAARAGNDEDGDEVKEGIRQGGMGAEEIPDDECEESDRNHDRDEVTGDHVHHPGDGRL